MTFYLEKKVPFTVKMDILIPVKIFNSTKNQLITVMFSYNNTLDSNLLPKGNPPQINKMVHTFNKNYSKLPFYSSKEENSSKQMYSRFYLLS